MPLFPLQLLGAHSLLWWQLPNPRIPVPLRSSGTLQCPQKSQRKQEKILVSQFCDAVRVFPEGPVQGPTLQPFHALCDSLIPSVKLFMLKICHTGLPWQSRLRLCAPSSGCLGLNPGQGTRSRMLQLRVCMPQLNIPHATTKTQCSQINKYVFNIKIFKKLPHKLDFLQDLIQNLKFLTPQIWPYPLLNSLDGNSNIHL